MTDRITDMNPQRRTVFADRYALKDETGMPTEFDPTEMFERVADGIAQNPNEAADFLAILEDFKFVPGGRILAGAGTDSEVTYYNCYVIPIETRFRRGGLDLSKHDAGSDSREAILDTISVMVDIMSRGGGVGINWSVLRPKGAYLTRVNGHTSGPVSWMDVASHAVQTVTQGGSRRGAAMFMLDDWHPDVLEFIEAKRDLTKITGANVSVAISDAFMQAVKDDAEWEFVFPDTKHPMYDSAWDGDLAKWRAEYSEAAVVGYGTKPAREVWRAISQAAWDNGEPGVIFLERYNDQSTAKGIERIICVNPCGEQGLGPYSVCNLGAMNLDAYVTKKSQWDKVVGYEFDWDSFTEDVAVAVRFLDNVVDQNYYFLPENEAVQKDLRRIGLGAMGLADALIGLGLRYGSQEAVEFTERVFRTLKDTAIEESVRLAVEKGPAPAWDSAMWDRPYLAEYVQRNGWGKVASTLKKPALRNLFLLTQAPTGSTSIVAGVNSGIEPLFSLSWTRVDRTGTHRVYAPSIEKYIPEGIEQPEYVVTADTVTVEEHIAMQAAVQKYVDSSVSKTINAPNDHTVEDVERAYTLAYDSGLKGVAYFRDGCGRAQVLYKDEPKSEGLHSEEDIQDLIQFAVEFDRPTVLAGRTHKVGTKAGTAYVTVNRDGDGVAREVFFNVGKAGSDVAALVEALGRLASLALRKGATLGGVANQLDGVGGASNFNRSVPHAIAQALSEDHAGAVTAPSVVHSEVEQEKPQRSVSADVCPECHNVSLVREEGCSKCAVCAYSAC